ncbi:peptidoglycan-binding protein [Streptomyces sp. NBC_01017]|uniref:peptidoglycan-binding domain-containing protein n=1 Tax=Streptomyces sp. NBC_01017 TaxID=2903721 RepID=UPI0038658C64|nr:peptidoglycan-binding protein [Streptomyces sp. NBC_01017]
MSEPNGPVCPECDTPRASDGTPACSCARLASDARRDARTAEAAAAEDFAPLRIRPFVEPGDDAGAVGPAIVEEVPQEARDLEIPRDLATQGDAGDADDSPVSPALDAEPLQDPPRKHRPLLIAGAGAALVVLVTGAVLGGLHLYDSPSRAGAASDDVRPPVPDSSTEDGTSPEGQSAATATASSASDPASSPSKRPTDSSATPADSSPTTAPSTAGAGTSAPAPEPTAVEGRPPVLRLGDEGPEVTELQLRLRQIGLYAGDIDGDYDRVVEGSVRTYQLTRVILSEQSGVYGTATRTSLESETSEP